MPTIKIYNSVILFHRLYDQQFLNVTCNFGKINEGLMDILVDYLFNRLYT